jgi:hypothetical protein
MKGRIIISLLLLLGFNAYGQTGDCKVLIPNLAGTYSGECKKGLAHGNGVAQGIDRYEGNFFKGVPDGKGIYKWADGSSYDGEWKNGVREGIGRFVKGDSVAAGYWKGDKYQGNVKLPNYKITGSRNLQRYTFTKSVETQNGVRIKLMLGGAENTEVEDFSLAYSSGSEYRNVGTYGIQNSNVPLDVVVRYRTWNQLHSAQYDVFFEFTIHQPGTYNVILTNM